MGYGQSEGEFSGISDASLREIAPITTGRSKKTQSPPKKAGFGIQA
jgi:hypothetical protein|tara:strand:- start:2593 stop:2730 length:138 start_codon:yes stop_codon:yes gene_type:complete